MTFTSTTLAPPTRRRWPRVLLAVAIFLAGLVAGVALTIIFAIHIVQAIVHHPENAPARITMLLRHKLDLTPDQTPRVQQIITTHQQKIQQARQSIRPEIDTELNEARAEIDAVLNPDQRDKWEKLFDQTRARWMPTTRPAE